MTEEETIDEIVKNRKSICRFGDGEFSIMFGNSRWRFQRDDAKLAERLREVIITDEENILIGLNDFYGDLSDKTEYDAAGIRSYITPQIRAQHMEVLNTERVEDWYEWDAPRHLFIHSVKSMQYLCGKAGLKIKNVEYNAGDLQFITSLLYREGIPYMEQDNDVIKKYFSPEELNKILELTEELNRNGYGDHAVFAIEKVCS